MKILTAAAFLALTLIVSVAPLAAHHAWPVSYDRLVTVKGTVLAFDWANPHPMMTVDVETASGTKEQWRIGGPALTRMERNGWTKTTVQPGDVVTGIGYQFADGQKIVRLERVILANGRELRVYAR